MKLKNATKKELVFTLRIWEINDPLVTERIAPEEEIDIPKGFDVVEIRNV